jgi:taurine dioxygenase
VLHAVSLPDRGGDTQYVNMHVAYDELPEKTRRRLDGLRATHVYQSRHSARKLMDLGEEGRNRVPDAVIHPIVCTHPESGRKAIYINPIRIEGIRNAETEALTLLADLLEHATQPRYRTATNGGGDLVMWDNRSLLLKPMAITT